jgi:putative radical SAM enzyme (TIGR03279 family)
VSSRLQPIGAPGDLISGIERGRRGARQTGHALHQRGGEVESVDPDSPADRAGIRTGDIILSINGSRIRDVIDYQFLCADAEALRFEVLSPSCPEQSRVVTAFPPGDETLGISFTEPTFSPIRECNNHCPFCFIDQLPGSMRNSLYIRDDDYRFSFLFGNFVTLTNLNESDWKRLEEQRLSPLYVSVHATDWEMRRTLLGNEKIPDIMEQLERLFSLGIRVHTQVVACPGMNDGQVLEQTVRDLGSFYPGVLSIGVVPVGLTRTPAEILAGPEPSCSRILPSAADLPLRTFEPEEAREVVRQTRRWQRDFRKRHGCSVVYASDELYLLSGEPIPAAYTYDGYPQFENGIGMVRDLLDDWKRTKRTIGGRDRTARTPTVSLVCGEMIGECLGGLAEEWASLSGGEAQMCVTSNTFFGSRVRVSGLLTGGDIVRNASRYKGDVVVLPTVMLDKTGSRTIDGVTPLELSKAVGKPVRFASYMSEVDQIALVAASGALTA